MIIDIDENNFEEQTSKGLKLIIFSAKWCSYCTKQNEVLKELPDIWFGKVDGDKSSSLVSKYGVMGFPTFVLFKNGEVVTKFSGFKNKFELMNILSKFV